MEVDENPYPYGLEISLDEESMKTLGINPLPVGSKVEFKASAKVTSVSEHEREGSKKFENMSLQITDMYINKDSDEDVAGRFYGENKDG